jgi:hypothetical protein
MELENIKKRIDNHLVTYQELMWLVEQAEKVIRYERVLKEIAEDEEDCESKGEMGFIDYYDGWEKTVKAKEALES